MEIEVSSCQDCPFSSFSLAGGHKNLIWTARKRIQHSCNIQKLPLQYKPKGDYICFETCPLKNTAISVFANTKTINYL